MINAAEMKVRTQYAQEHPLDFIIADILDAFTNDAIEVSKQGEYQTEIPSSDSEEINERVIESLHGAGYTISYNEKSNSYIISWQ